MKLVPAIALSDLVEEFGRSRRRRARRQRDARRRAPVRRRRQQRGPPPPRDELVVVEPTSEPYDEAYDTYDTYDEAYDAEYEPPEETPELGRGRRRRPSASSGVLQLGKSLRIKARNGTRPAAVELKPGLYLVCAVPEAATRTELGFVPLLAPVIVKAAKKALSKDAPGATPRPPKPKRGLQLPALPQWLEDELDPRDDEDDDDGDDEVGCNGRRCRCGRAR